MTTTSRSAPAKAEKGFARKLKQAPELFSYPKYWAECYGIAPYLPMSREEMDALGWDSCDIIIVTGDAYVDHPSFGMAVVGRFMESLGYRVGIISQPDWTRPDDFMKLGKPNLFFGVAAGNMDSMINHYTADLKIRSDDVYTPNGEPGKRPDRAVTVYTQRCRQAYKNVPVYIGGIEASLRRIAQYDHWTSEVRRSVLVDSGADILIYGNAERAMAELAYRVSSGESVDNIDDIRGTVVIKKSVPGGWTEIDSSRIDWPRDISSLEEAYGGNPYECKDESTCQKDGEDDDVQPVRIIPLPLHRKADIDESKTCIRLPSFEKVNKDPVLYAHASRVLHQESNPQNARVLIQKHGNHEVWVNPPPIPLTTPEIDGVFGLFYQRRPHPAYGAAKIPAYDMIKTSVNIMRGCFGGCSFCSITEHEGRVIQSRSQESILQELEDIRDKVDGFTGQISDLGGPTANMYFLNCKSPAVHANCRRLSCVFPSICKNLETSHEKTTELYRAARNVRGIKKIAIASGLRYDLAVLDPEYVRELVTYHVGGYLKIAPEHTEKNTLDLMMKPGMGTYDAFRKMFEKFSKEAGKKQYLIPYFIAAHPGCTDEDMMNLGLWLKKNGFRVDQVQTFYPSPMSLATAMYHSGRNPLKRVTYKDGRLYIPRQFDQRRLHKAFLRNHDEKNYDLLRKALTEMGRTDLIGNGEHQLVPPLERRGSRADQRYRPQGGRPPARTAAEKPVQKARGGQWDNRSSDRPSNTSGQRKRPAGKR